MISLNKQKQIRKQKAIQLRNQTVKAHTGLGLGLLGVSFFCPPLVAAWWVHLFWAASDVAEANRDIY